MILVIDIGNSRTKWGIFDNADKLREQGVYLNTILNFSELLTLWGNCKSALVSNVAGAEMADKLSAVLTELDIPVTWVKSSDFACGVSNSYLQPEKLGVDRWVSLIAAWQRYYAPCVVVNAGTALTIDALGVNADGAIKHGIFLGGLIVPGLRLMQDSLLQRTAGISAGIEVQPEISTMQDFPVTTGDALYTGALSAMAGAVNSMLVKLHQHTDLMPRCILSGGDAAALAQALKSDYELIIADNLVLEGLLLIERAL